MTDPLRTLLGPLLPEGLTNDLVLGDFHAKREIPDGHWWELPPTVEALDPLTNLASKDNGIKRGNKVLKQAEYEKLKAQQAAVRESYQKALDALLRRAEKEGPAGRKKILDDYQRVARDHLRRSHSLGVRLTASGPVAKAKDQLWEGYIKERAAHDRLHFNDFLSAIWEKREIMPRTRRRDLYVNNLDAIMSQGALAGTRDDITINWKLSPAEHCFDCIGLAANNPYGKPGVKSNLPTLPTVPRRGDTQCLARCKCFLTFINEKGEPVDPEERPGVSMEDTDGNEIDPESSAEMAIAQKKADQLQEDMLYYRTMFELTGNKKWNDMRRAANQELIDLGDEYGIRIVPKSKSTAMRDKVADAQEAGWQPALKPDAAKFTEGQYIGVVKGTDFHRGQLVSWDVKKGMGQMETLDGQIIDVGTADKVPTIMMAKKLDAIPAKPWKIHKPPQVPEGATFDLPGKPNAITIVEPPGKPVDVAPQVKATKTALEKTAPGTGHGVNVWLQPEKGRAAPLEPDTRKAFGKNGIELHEKGKVISIRGGITAKPEEVERDVLLGVGANAWGMKVSGTSRQARFSSLLKKTTDFLMGNGGSRFINVTTNEAAFGAAYYLYIINPTKLATQSPALFKLVQEVVEEFGHDLATVLG